MFNRSSTAYSKQEMNENIFLRVKSNKPDKDGKYLRSSALPITNPRTPNSRYSFEAEDVYMNSKNNIMCGSFDPKSLSSDGQMLKHKYDQLYKDYQKLQKKYNSLERENAVIRDSFDSGQARTSGIRKLLSIKLKRRASKEDLIARNIMKNEPVFNTTLQNVIQDDCDQIPLIVVKCIAILEANENFMSTPGIYRVCGNYSLMQTLRFEINSNKYKTLEKLKTPHEITGILKMFFRELKISLVTQKEMRQINSSVDFTKSLAEQIDMMKRTVDSLLPLNRKVLAFYIKHLNKITTYKKNQMSPNNLATVTFSTIFNEISDDICPQQCMELITTSIKLTYFFIENANKIFC